MDGLDRAIQKAGSVVALAKGINAAISAPSMWKKRGRVPADKCPAIERFTGVPCEELRPDVDWAVLRGKPLPAGSPPTALEAAHA